MQGCEAKNITFGQPLDNLFWTEMEGASPPSIGRGCPRLSKLFLAGGLGKLDVGQILKVRCAFKIQGQIFKS
jgi:hypothetical protein